MTGPDLRTWRHTHKMTQAELATRLGITIRTVTRWEQGRCPIPVSVTLALPAIVHQGSTP